jgi:hypothetical protein
MALVVPNTKGEILFLQYIMGIVAPGDKILRLFSNDVTPTDTSVVGDLTQVDTATGYAPKTLTSANWTTTQVAGVTTAVYSEQTFNFTTLVTNYGYYVTDASGNLLFLERFTGAPFNIPDGGGTISVGPKLTAS